MPDVIELYRHHRGWLIAWLRQRVDCPQGAADLAQDTFLRLLRRVDPVSVRQPRAYLRRVAHGLAVDFIRHRDVERAYLEVLASFDAAVMPSEEERALTIETLVRIEAMLDGLPARARAAFLMSRLEGLGYREIAERLGVSLSTVEKDMGGAIRHCYSIRYGQ